MKLTDHKARFLALAVSMALAACGGSGDGTSPGGEQVKDAGPPAASTSNTSTKAPDTPPISETAVRGDVVIQALLATTDKRESNNRTVYSRLSPVNRTSVSTDSFEYPLASPWAVLSVQTNPDTSRSLGAHVLQFSTWPGSRPGHGSQEDVVTLEKATAQLGVSTPGVAVDGNALAALGSGPLEIGRQIRIRIEPNQLTRFAEETGNQVVETTLSAAQPLSVAQDAELRYDTELQTWKGEGDFSEYRALLQVSRADNTNPNQFKLCLNVGKSFGDSSTICSFWEVPTGWTRGQPLKLLHQTLEDSHHSEHLGSVSSANFSSASGPRTVNSTDLETTTEPISEYGISGAVLAAMFDAWTPRGNVMAGLAPFAASASGPLSPTATTTDPARVSLLVESRATQYQDGATTGAYSPATGSYLHSLQIGTYTGPNSARAGTAAFPQQTLALHVANNAAEGFTLPRWTGVNVLGPDQNGAQRWLVQSEQLSEGKAQKTIKPNELILLGSAVQVWHEPAPGNNNERVHVLLSIEQSQPDDRTVDLCWSTDSTAVAISPRRICTLWQIPQGWKAGQPLRPEGWYVERALGSGPVGYWNTFVGAN